MSTSLTELVTTFDLPDTELSAAAFELAESTNSRPVFDHCVRSYLFGRELATSEGLRAGSDFDDELLFLCCVLHDMGLTARGDTDDRFEVAGADVAARFLRDRGAESGRVEVVWDAIALHTAAGIAVRKGPEIAFTQRGIFTDVLGVEKASLPERLLDEVAATLPRRDLGYVITEEIVGQVLENPAKYSPATFGGSVALAHPGGKELPTWFHALAAAPWGDRPVTDAPG